jgi:hypothetical protein
MKILIIQEKGRHKENEEFRECLNLKRAFDRLGVESVVWGLNHPTFQTPFEEISKDCDVIFLLENYEAGGWIPDMSSCSKLKVFWSIDSHWNLMPHLETCSTQRINILLNSTHSYLRHFKKGGRKCFWFPNAYPSDLIKPLEGIQKEGVGFCGNVVNRGGAIQFLQREVGMRFDNFVIGPSMVKVMNSYKIGWNMNIKDDINYRTFETPGCRTFLITNETDRLRDLFEVGRHLVTYTDLPDCVSKIQYYLKNDKERQEIQDLGYEHALKNHTYDNRAQLFLEIVNQS